MVRNGESMRSHVRNRQRRYGEALNASPRRLDREGETARWQVTIVDACCYGRIGMKEALNSHPDIADIQVAETLNGALSRLASNPLRASSPFSCLVLKLSMTAPVALTALLQLGELSFARYSRVVVMSYASPDTVCRVLESIGVNSTVRVVDARCTCLTLCGAIVAPSTPECVLPAHRKGECRPSEVHPPLSQRERHTLGKTLREMSVYTQARQSQVSAKTVYTQRARALMKLGVPDLLTLLRQFTPGRQNEVNETRERGRL